MKGREEFEELKTMTENKEAETMTEKELIIKAGEELDAKLAEAKKQEILW